MWYAIVEFQIFVWNWIYGIGKFKIRIQCQIQAPIKDPNNGFQIEPCDSKYKAQSNLKSKAPNRPLISIKFGNCQLPKYQILLKLCFGLQLNSTL